MIFGAQRLKKERILQIAAFGRLSQNPSRFSGCKIRYHLNLFEEIRHRNPD